MGKVGLLSRPLSGSGAKGRARRNAAAKQTRIMSLFLCGKKQLSHRKHCPCEKAKVLKSLGAGGQMRKRICVQTRSGIARERGRKAYERCSAPVGFASQTESKGPSFSSTPAGRSSFSQQEKKKRGLQKSVPRAERGKKFPLLEKRCFPPAQRAKEIPAHGVGEKCPAHSAGNIPAPAGAQKKKRGCNLHPLFCSLPVGGTLI